VFHPARLVGRAAKDLQALQGAAEAAQIHAGPFRDGGARMNGTNNGKERPEKNFKVGGVRAAVWKWVNTAKDGRTFTQRKVVLDRSYRDANGNWKNSNSFDTNDIPKAILALCRAFDYIHSSAEDDHRTQVTEEYVG
jgi:hypothetical protein